MPLSRASSPVGTFLDRAVEGYEENRIRADYNELYESYSFIVTDSDRYSYTEEGDHLYILIKNLRLGYNDEVGYGAEYGGIGTKTKKYDKNEFEPCNN